MIKVQKEKSGFTLIELIIVVAIIAVLAGAMVPLFSSNKLEAQIAKANSDLDAIKTANLLLHVDTGKYAINTGSDDTGKNLTTNTDTFVNWNGPYIDDYRNDPFGNAYIMKVTGSQLTVSSGGPDGAATTTDDLTTTITNNVNN